ncbi:putative bifunctional diguanylate cyclase/phosphodiesterase [Sulfuricaulis sp.]|jgi:diguanylate cyclase (GGDEF)-like protein/PAS domain S-box-containing protein|uniref:putative bifunctional diguanylate cyclase/phosphodiesterase n=1 Tax=Sulfuricaulis sp. TaxID=2003553 RepID=UPI003559A5FB
MMRLRLFPRTLRARIAASFSILLLFTAAAVTLAFARQAAHAHLETQQQLAQNLMVFVEPAVRGMVTNYDVTGLDNYMQKIAADPTIASIRIVDEGGGSLLYQHQGNAEPASWMSRILAGVSGASPLLISEVNVNGAKVGRIEAVLSYAPLNQSVRHVMVVGSALTAIVLAVAFLLAYLLLTRFTAPLRPLMEWAREFAHGNWHPRVKLIESGSREIQELNQAFADGSATMRHYIQSLEETRELLEYSETRLRKLVNSMHEILFELDADGHIIFLNPAWQALTGFTADDSLGKSFSDFLLGEDAIRDFEVNTLPRLHEKNREISLRSADGKHLWMSLDADAQTDSAGNFTGIIGTFSDITRSVELNHLLSRYQDELYHLSVTDPLTGLYNRRHFDSQLEVILSDHLPKNMPVCLLLIDLDGFKFINDTYGHPFGDEVLRTTAQLLKQQVRRNDYIARLAGDEFAMVLKNTDIENATRIAQKLHDCISDTRIPLPVGHMQLQSSMGVAEAPTHGANAQDLVSAADVALYHSKRGGRNRIEVLSPDISKAVMSIFSQGFQLRNAIEQGHIHPAFQPICNLKNGIPMAYEVLARMRVNGLVIQAKDFITVAEELGLTREVDLHVIGQALLLSPSEHALFLNVDISSFNDKEFVQDLSRLLKPACAEGRSITIEITERETIPLSDGLHQDIQTLRAFGCKLALDDFGSGYSTYNFLNQFRPDYLKIEGSFVRGMLQNEADRKIVTHIHELASSFGMQTIAESVEDAATEHALQEIGICNAQGLFYGAPRLVS